MSVSTFLMPIRRRPVVHIKTQGNRSSSRTRGRAHALGGVARRGDKAVAHLPTWPLERVGQNLMLRPYSDKPLFSVCSGQMSHFKTQPILELLEQRHSDAVLRCLPVGTLSPARRCSWLFLPPHTHAHMVCDQDGRKWGFIYNIPYST